MSKRTYQEDLESKGLSKNDGSYDVTAAVERCHEAFTMLSDAQRLKIQNVWGSKFIAELERFGRYTERQSNLVQEPAIMFRDLSDGEEKRFRQHARDGYVIGSPIDSLWHPHYQDECERMNAEV